jgi:hypothetical protein
MSFAGADTWTRRYEEALLPGAIKERGQRRGAAVEDLAALEIEVACRLLELALEAVILITGQLEAVIRREIERALAHARLVYSEPRAALRAGYSSALFDEALMPTFITGLAGVGKSWLRRAIGRILSGRRTISIDPSHPSVPLVDYVESVIRQQPSVPAVLKPLASPEVASGRAKMNQGDLPAECARWLRLSGVCLLGVDETQFMAQSDRATALITRTLLALAEVHVPWFVVANYSLVWKLRNRPSEAQQRLLSRPVVILPDPPASADWHALLAEYQIVFGEVLDFTLVNHCVELWNFCAGLKRELVRLLVLSYRVARLAAATRVEWRHVENAYGSGEFSVSRSDIEMLIAHAGQGGKLRKDLQCPFVGDEIKASFAVYSDQLRAARQASVARASLEAAMNAQEKSAIEAIKSAEQPPPPPPARVIQLPKRKRRSLEEMLQAGHELWESDSTPKS